jgi:hypothetical protein
MIEIEFLPKKGIPFIDFGTDRKEVQRIMISQYGASDPVARSENTDCYFENSLQFSFEEDNSLSFIEASTPPPVGVKLLGMDTWKISGRKLLNFLKTKDEINLKLSEGGESPIFKNYIITLWDLDKQYDHFGGFTKKKWGTIGIGDERYYKAISEIFEED